MRRNFGIIVAMSAGALSAAPPAPVPVPRAAAQSTENPAADFAAALASTPDEASVAKVRRLTLAANTLRSEGLLTEAIAVGEWMLDFERTQGAPPATLVKWIDWLGGASADAEDWRTAEAWRRDAVAVWESIRPIDHWEAADARRALDDVQRLQRLSAEQSGQLREADRARRAYRRLFRVGRYVDAVKQIAEAAAIHKAVLGEFHAEYARDLHRLGVLHSEMADYSQAEPAFRQALAIRDKGPRAPGLPGHAQ